MWKFKAEIKMIGINPFVFVPEEILKELFIQSGKNEGHIAISGSVNNQPYKQTLVRYHGEWRLYINTTMLKNSPKRIGEWIEVSIAYDNTDRTLTPHPRLIAALNENLVAKEKFESQTPSLQKEIVRYISLLKTEESVDKNVHRAIQFLLGNGTFIGRGKL